ncbi:ROK family glucokinase [Nocardiopsis sp. RSe5-2]|uniref:Glucokinase n=1 Tax=Nocardiopsis endophytica TaxID=3018445 RepID=A0ABT4UCY0_9ACTN|nr:ROK family glucokinase [Nocardiopsis endophytica]MDA2814152.1 ROK family glucokinase [Nocardiopsis endophytica]
MALTIGVDIGGTKIAAGTVDPEGRILRRAKAPTPRGDGEELAEAVAGLVRELREGEDTAPAAVGVGTAGFVDETRSRIVLAGNLGLADDPVRDRIARRVDLPVVVENDANAAAWAEFRFGAGRGCRDAVVVTLGTGVGGALIVDGELRRGRFGAAGEIGHYRMVPFGRRCACGNQGCWEQYASGSALVAEARALAAAEPKEAARLLEAAGGDPEGIEGPEVTRAAQEGDPAALRCFAAVGEWVGQGLADLAAILDPERFVVGGGVSAAGEILLEPARQAYARAVTGRATRRLADIRQAELGGEPAGIIGAADLALR